MSKIVFIRHTPSVWNEEKRLVGWEDVPLNSADTEELHTLAKKLLDQQYSFDVAITSYLQRSILSTWIILSTMNLDWIQEVRDWRLNARHLGVLEGITLDEAIEQYGKDQLQTIMSTYHIQAPLLTEVDPRNPRLDQKYAMIEHSLPLGESYQDVELRVNKCYEDVIIPLLKEGKSILISAHEDSLKLLLKMMESLSNEEMLQLEMPHGQAVVLEYANEQLQRFIVE